jgi:uncharacterized protein YggE
LSEEDYTEAVTPSQPQPQPVLSPRPKRRLPITLLLLLVAIAIIGGLLYVCKPWQQNVSADQRTITVAGEAKVVAEPDEYVFRPHYVSKAADQQTALQTSTAKINEVVSKLKGLGVPSNKIKTNSYGYESYYDSSNQTYSAYIEATIGNKQLAQKVQDYLLTTSPQGAVTPQANFSDAKKRHLQDEGRDKATKDARAKAEQSAKNLDFKLGKVKTFEDNTSAGLDDPVTMGANSATVSEDSLSIQAGEDSLTYRVKVTYYLK